LNEIIIALRILRITLLTAKVSIFLQIFEKILDCSNNNFTAEAFFLGDYSDPYEYEEGFTHVDAIYELISSKYSGVSMLSKALYIVIEMSSLCKV